MNTDFSSQLYILMSLSHLNSLGFESNNNILLKTLIPIIITFSPIIIKVFLWFYEIMEDWIYMKKSENIISIKFPVHELIVHKDSYKDSDSKRQLYSINYIAINDYIRDNLNNINGISNLVEILNVCANYYSDDTNEKNFVLIPVDSSEILIEPINKIYCKISSTKNSSNNSDNNENKKINNNIKTYELLLFIKLDSNTNFIKIEQEKKDKLVLLNKFINGCVKRYNDKNELNNDGKHWIYEYYHSFKNEYLGLELQFKEYLFENNKDLETNIFFEGKEKIIKYVDKFIYNQHEIQNKIINKYEEEYKNIGYTYKATFLFYGFPGCGKTSTIKAILNRTKRHGIIINWNKIKTCEELELVFRNRTINHKDYDSRELCYIIEDCDASADNILLSRKNNNNLNNNNLSNDEMNDSDFDSVEINNYDNTINNNINNNINKKILKNKKKNNLKSIEKIIEKTNNLNLEKIKNNNKSINLSCLLNILDGIIELHGVMVIFTTNYPEKLDEAFLRPGRIDFKQEFKRATVSTLKSILKSKFSSEFNDDIIGNNFIDYILSPAEIQSICFKNDNINDCIKELILETNKYKNTRI